MITSPRLALAVLGMVEAGYLAIDTDPSDRARVRLDGGFDVDAHVYALGTLTPPDAGAAVYRRIVDAHALGYAHVRVEQLLALRDITEERH